MKGLVMGGSVEGGKKAATTNKAKYGDNFYRKIGANGGRNSNNGGFASDKVGPDGLTGRERALIVGAVGGKISKRGPTRQRS
jgi:hypothetical protein